MEYTLSMKPRRRPAFRRPRPKYANLRAYMVATGDTQVNIAKAVGITQAQVSRILSGRVMPRPAVAIRLATYAQIPIDSFTWTVARQQGVA